jgi:hypothetical protein
MRVEKPGFSCAVAALACAAGLVSASATPSEFDNEGGADPVRGTCP